MKCASASSIYVLGFGCIAAPGYGPDRLSSAFEQGWRPSLAHEWEIAGHAEQSLAAISNFDAANYLRMRGLRPLSRASRLGCVAAAAALNYPTQPAENMERHAVVVGTQWGSIEPLVEFDRSAATIGIHLVDPGQFPNVVVNVHAGYLGILFGLAGPNLTLCGPSAGLEAIVLAVDMMHLGRADYALAGGIEALGLTLLHGLEREGEISGVTMQGEGAAFLLLSDRGTTERPALARVAGFATATANRTSDRNSARAAAIRGVLESWGSNAAAVRTIWSVGESQDKSFILNDNGAIIKRLERVTGDCRAANGALAAVLAAYEISQGASAVIVTDFPPIGAQTALLLCQP